MWWASGIWPRTKRADPVRARDIRAGEGGRALLFDRLTDLSPELPEEERPFRTLSRDELRQSIRRELARILNARSITPLEILESREWTVLDYGLPDYSGWYTRASSARTKLEELVRRTIETFEPRLVNPVVRVAHADEGEHLLRVHVEGSMQVGRTMEPVSFPLALQPTRRD